VGELKSTYLIAQHTHTLR